MSDRPEVEYRSYVLHYAENEDVWRSYTLDLQADRLPTLKAKIDKLIATRRKLTEGLPALNLGNAWSMDKAMPCTIVAKADDGQYVWVTTAHKEMWRGATRVVSRRQKLNLASLVPDTPQGRAMVAEFQRQGEEIRALQKARDEYRKSIPTIDVSDLGIDEE